MLDKVLGIVPRFAKAAGTLHVGVINLTSVQCNIDLSKITELGFLEESLSSHC
jgi:hypothetical protein